MLGGIRRRAVIVSMVLAGAGALSASASVSTFNPDSGSGGSTKVDGFAYKSGGPDQTFSSIRTTTSQLGANSASNPENIAYLASQSTTDQWAELYRGIFNFN